MLDWQHGQAVYECDGCDETLQTGEREFERALTVLKRERWRSVKDTTGWLQLCPDCQ